MAAVIFQQTGEGEIGASECLRGENEVRTDGTGRVETVKRGQRGSRIRFVRAMRRREEVWGMQGGDKVEGGESFSRFHHLARGAWGVGGRGDWVLGGEATGGHLKAF